MHLLVSNIRSIFVMIVTIYLLDKKKKTSTGIQSDALTQTVGIFEFDFYYFFILTLAVRAAINIQLTKQSLSTTITCSKWVMYTYRNKL